MNFEDLSLDLDASSTSRAIDRTAMLHESSLGLGHQMRRLTSGAGNLDPVLRVEEFWLEEGVMEPSPAAGTAVLTYVFDDSAGGLLLRTSKVGEQLMSAGDVTLLVHGDGVVTEVSPHQSGRLCHGLTVTVNLALDHKTQSPSLQHCSADERCTIKRGALIGYLLAGRSDGFRGALQCPTSITVMDVHLAPGAYLNHDAAVGEMAVVVVLKGKALIGPADDARSVRAGVAVSLYDDNDLLTVRATDDKCQLLIISATPIAQPVFVNDEFVMTHPQQLADAHVRFDNGEMGSLGKRKY
jgi:redox-sensitive bicupin YhaK (pirin superfamily)